MAYRQLREREDLRAALGPTQDCPQLEDLQSFAAGEVPPATALAGHIHSCQYCQTELHLLQTFLQGQAEPASQNAKEAKDANKVAELLRLRSGEIIRRAVPTEERIPWWKAAFTARRLAQVSLAAAAILLVAAGVVYFRSGTSQPQLQAANDTGSEVLRSGGFAVLNPVGDLESGPKEIRWEPIANATRYRAILVEVDRSEMWKGETAANYIELPAAIQARIVPAKTLFSEVIAYDSSGNKVGDTGLIRFRVLQR
jgi:hypothetical protein